MLDGGWGIFSGALASPPTGQTITTTAVSTNVMDLMVGRDIGPGAGFNGQGQMLHAVVINAFDNGATPTLQIQIQAAPDNGSGAPGTYSTLLETDAISGSSLIAGARLLRTPWPDIQLNFPAGDIHPPRFLRLNYIVGSGPFTVGTLLAYLADEREERLIYPANFTTA
jgi:hypothetical protein